MKRLAGAAAALAVAAVAAAALAGTGAAPPTPPKCRGKGCNLLRYELFLATFEATRTLRWEIPRTRLSDSDCDVVGGGEQTYRVTTRRPVPATWVGRTGGGRDAGVTFDARYSRKGSYTGSAGFSAVGRFTRQGRIVLACGGVPQFGVGSPQPEGYEPGALGPEPDCGTRTPSMAVDVEGGYPKVSLNAYVYLTRVPDDFPYCPVAADANHTAGWDLPKAFDPANASSSVPYDVPGLPEIVFRNDGIARFFDCRVRTIRWAGSERTREQGPVAGAFGDATEAGPTWRSSVELEWQLTFRRVGCGKADR